MSEAGPSYDWVISLGSLLGIIVSVTAVAAAAYKILGFLRTRLSKQVLDTRDELSQRLGQLQEKVITSNQTFNAVIEEKVKSGDKKLEEIRWWMHTLEENSDRKDQDILKKLDEHRNERNERLSEVKADMHEISEEFAKLKEQYYQLSLSVARMDKKVNGDNNNNKAPVK